MPETLIPIALGVGQVSEKGEASMRRQSKKHSGDDDFNEQNAIDHKATLILTNALPANWYKGMLIPDVRKDYHIELRDGNALNGVTFQIQQKGKKNLRIANGKATLPDLKRKDIRYWMRQRRPIFLVAIDVTSGEGYWLFVQEYVKAKLCRDQYHGGGTLSVQFPIEQNLQNMDGLRSAVEKADIYMAGQHPDAISSSLNSIKEQYESLDRRILVLPTVTENVVHLEFVAKEPVEFHMTFPGDHVRANRLASDIFGKGLPTEIMPGDVQITGSSLFAKIFEEASVFQTGSRVPLDLDIEISDESGNKVRIPFRNAEAQGGFEEQRLTAALSNSILSIHATLGWTSAKFTIHHDFKHWARQPILNLPYFDQIGQFYSALAAGREVRLVGLFRGTRIIDQVLPSDAARSKNTWTVLDLLAKARELASRIGVNPSFPEKLESEHLKDILEVYDATDPAPRSASDYDGVSKTPRKALKALYDQIGINTEATGTVWISNEMEGFRFFDTDVQIPAFIVQMTGLRLEVADLAGELARDTDDFVDVRWKGTEKSIRTTRQVTPDELLKMRESSR